MKQYLRPEQLADLFLSYLFIQRKIGSGSLSGFFGGKKIYIDAQLADEVIALLSTRKLIKPVEHTLDLLAFSNENVRKEGEVMKPAHFLDGFAIEGSYPQFDITPRGMAFISHGQKLDIEDVIEHRENVKKWKDRTINIIVAVLTALLVLLMTEPVKRRLEQSNGTKNQVSNEGSTIRPRIDQR